MSGTFQYQFYDLWFFLVCVRPYSAFPVFTDISNAHHTRCGLTVYQVSMETVRRCGLWLGE